MDNLAQSNNSNYHIQEYLRYYLGLKVAPGFAVLLDGPWGIGKTYLLLRFLNEYYTDLQKYAYVSLYGLATTADIDRALAHAIYPFLNSDASKVAGQAARAVAGYFRIKPEFRMEDLVNKGNAPVYVFDDLERSEIPVSQALGYINGLVEHDGRKVIIVADQTKIRDERYGEIREKLIGKTLAVQSVLDDALTHFFSELRDRAAAKALESRRAVVADLYRKADLNNLRMLRQGLWEFERVYVALSGPQRQHDGAVSAILALVLSLTFELKAMRLEPEDLESRVRQRFSGLMSGQAMPPMREAAQRYDGYDLYDQILSDAVLGSFLVRGLAAPAEIQASVEASRYFSLASEPEWRVAWHFQERDEAEVVAAYQAMDSKFDGRSYTIPGEIMHVFALRLWRARNGIIDTSPESAVQDCRKYIADMRTKGVLPAPSDDRSGADLRLGYGGLGFIETDEPIVALAQELLEARRYTFEASLPDQAQALLGLISTNLDEFEAQISFQAGMTPKYYSTPIFAAAAIGDFMSQFTILSAPDQRAVLFAIHARYDLARLRNELRSELPWLTRLQEHLTAYANTQSPLGQTRIAFLTQWCVASLLEAVTSDMEA